MVDGHTRPKPGGETVQRISFFFIGGEVEGVALRRVLKRLLLLPLVTVTQPAYLPDQVLPFGARHHLRPLLHFLELRCHPRLLLMCAAFLQEVAAAVAPPEAEPPETTALGRLVIVDHGRVGRCEALVRPRHENTG